MPWSSGAESFAGARQVQTRCSPRDGQTAENGCDTQELSARAAMVNFRLPVRRSNSGFPSADPKGVPTMRPSASAHVRTIFPELGRQPAAWERVRGHPLVTVPTSEPQGPARTGREAEKSTTKSLRDRCVAQLPPSGRPGPGRWPHDSGIGRQGTFPCSMRSETIKTTDTLWQDAHWLTAVQNSWLRARESKDWRRARVR
jgi:hypothetical protein